jgi:hypothetical protein
MWLTRPLHLPSTPLIRKSFVPESLKDQYSTTPLAGGNASYVESLY